jgi:hypothetical protein
MKIVNVQHVYYWRNDIFFAVNTQYFVAVIKVKIPCLPTGKDFAFGNILSICV